MGKMSELCWYIVRWKAYQQCRHVPWDGWRKRKVTSESTKCVVGVVVKESWSSVWVKERDVIYCHHSWSVNLASFLTFWSIASLSFCISSKATSQLPVRISAASLPHRAEKLRSESVDYQNGYKLTYVEDTIIRTYQNAEMIEHISSTSVVTAVELKLTIVIQRQNHAISELIQKSAC